MISPEAVIDKHFSHLSPNQRDYTRFIKNKHYRRGFKVGYDDYDKPNQFREGSLEWAAWYDGYYQRKADDDFWNMADN